MRTHAPWFRVSPIFPAFLLVAAVTLQVATQGEPRWLTLILFLAALFTWVVLLSNVSKREHSGRVVAIAAGIALTACVAIPPATSKDVNSYAIYGRIVSVYDRSPYTHVPRDFPGDVWYPRVSYYWSDSPSVYGPVFTAVSAGVVKAAGDSPAATRIGFQLIGALSLIAATALAARRIKPALAIVLIACNPLLLTFGVNDAHCDVSIGALLLAGALALERKRVVVGALAITAAALVKISVLPALAGAFIWLWFTGDRRKAMVFGGISTALFVVSVIAAGGLDVLEPLRQAAARHTRFSIWNPLHGWLTSWLGSAPPTQSRADHVVSALASLVVGVTAIAVIWRHRREATPFLVIIGGLVAYQVLGAYTLSWYAAWSLPIAALVWQSRTAVVAMLHGSWVAVAYLSGWGSLVVTIVVIVWLISRRISKQPAIPQPKPSEQRILAG